MQQKMASCLQNVIYTIMIFCAKTKLITVLALQCASEYFIVK